MKVGSKVNKETDFQETKVNFLKDLPEEAPEVRAPQVVEEGIDVLDEKTEEPEEKAAEKAGAISGEKKAVKKGIARQIDGNMTDVDAEWSAINPDENPLESLKVLPMWVPFAIAVGLWAVLAVIFSLKDISTIVWISVAALVGFLIFFRVRGRQLSKRARWISENPTFIRQEELAKVLDSDCDKLAELRKEIKNPKIGTTIDSIGKTMKSMADNLEANPSEKTKIRKVVVHYVPMMIELVGKYTELEKQSLEGDNVKTSMESIEYGLEKVDDSFKKYLDDMFADDKLEIQTDIKVMENLLTKGDAKANKMDFDGIIDDK